MASPLLILPGFYLNICRIHTQTNLPYEDADWNPHYMWVREGRTLEISGMLAISVDIPQVIADRVPRTA
jgi:hypothetical protein